jgi:hypothetical protein
MNDLVEMETGVYFTCPRCKSDVSRTWKHMEERGTIPTNEELMKTARSMGDLTCVYCKFTGPIDE